MTRYTCRKGKPYLLETSRISGRPLRLRCPLALTTAAAVIVLAACGSDTSDTDATSDQGSGSSAAADIPEGWHWAEGEDVPEVSAEPQLPVTVTDGAGEEVEVDDASKIIVGGDDVAAIVGGFGLADNVAAAPTNSASEVALNAPEQFEFSKESGPEGLLAMKGTLFVGNNTARHGSIAKSFNKAGSDAVVVDDHQSVVDKIRALGSYLGMDDAAEDMATGVEDQLEEAGKIADEEGLGDLKVIQVTSSGAGGATRAC